MLGVNFITLIGLIWFLLLGFVSTIPHTLTSYCTDLLDYVHLCSLFYDPITKQPCTWTYIDTIIVKSIVCGGCYVYGKSNAQ